MKNLSDVLDLIFEEPEAPADAPMGQYAFAPTRTDTPKPPEKNTPEEQEILQAIKLYITGNKKPGLARYANQLVQLADQGLYKKVLDPSNYFKVYRIIQLTEFALAKLVGKKEEELSPSGVFGSGIIPSHGEISGWTASLNYLTDNNTGYGHGRAMVVLMASTKTNKFFGNPGELAKAVGESGYIDEMETIAVGPVQYDKLAYCITGRGGGANNQDSLLIATKLLKDSMNTLKEYFDFLLTEGVVCSEAKKGQGEAPQSAEFGRFAFAPTRNDVPTPKEPNTKDEEQARQAIATYLSKNQKGPLSAVAPKLLDLQQQGYYSKVLDPGEHSQAFRFLRVPKALFAKMVGLEPSQIQIYGVLGGGTLSPQGSNISGWTVTTILFTKDGFDGYGDGDVAAIFIAPIEGNKFFGNPGTLAKAVGEPGFSFEMETVAVGPVQYSKCSYALLRPQEQNDPDLFKVRVIRLLGNAGVR